MMDQKTDFKSCSCSKCRSLCSNPGWFTPEEAERAIEAGYADKMMIDYLVGEPNIYILAPASKGCEKDRAPNTDELFGSGLSRFVTRGTTKGKCVLNKDGLCFIHDTDFKPLQCRSAMACEGDVGLDNTQMGEMWRNPEAQALVRRWMALVDLGEEVFEECF
jgi:Fe-S-cluster containining protein